MIWAMLGFSVGVTALLCISLAEFAAERPFFEANRAIIAGVLAVLGVAFWFVGRYRSAREAQEAKALDISGSASEASASPVGFTLFSCQYWAVIMIVFSASVLLVRPWRDIREHIRQDPKKLVRLIQKPLAKKTGWPGKTGAALPEELPRLKLQGVIFRKDNPAAIINGKTYYVGDKAEGAELIAVTRQFIVVRWEGGTNVLRLRE